jgi:hypothetical protein
MGKESSSSSISTGIGFPGLLTIVFVVFKLLGKITWSWWWVFAPIWISLVVTFAILGIVLLIAAIASR